MSHGDRDDDAAEELRLHLEAMLDANRRAGMSDDEARRDARLRFGNPRALQEEIHDLRRAWLLDLVADVRHAARRLCRAPGFSAAALLTLALGLGVNTALFAVLDAVLLRPLPYPQPERLVALAESSVDEPGLGGAVAPANMADYRVPALAGLAAHASQAMDLTGSGPPEALAGQFVGADYFEVLGAQPALGRRFLDAENEPGASHVVILGDGLWRRRFGADPRILERSIRLDGESYRVVGVMGADFQAPAEIGAPRPIEFHVPAALPRELLQNRGDHEVDVVARLAAGATLAEARAQLTAVSERLAKAYPDTNGPVRVRLTPLLEDRVGSLRRSLLLLLGAVAVVLLIACVNLANLMLVRALGRAREIAVRVALGAGRLRVLREGLAEAFLLSLAGGVLGVALAQATLRGLQALAPEGTPRLAEVALDVRVLAFAFALACLSMGAAAVLPGLLVSRVRPHESLRGAERSLVAAPTLRWGQALLVAEVALALVLLVGGGLLLRSFAQLHAVEVGFETERVLAQRISLPESRYPDAEHRLAFFEELERRVAGLPGVEAVAFANRFPLRGGWSTGMLLDSSRQGERFEADAQAVSLRYFETLGIPLVRGRGLLDSDRRGQPGVAIVNQLFARQAYPGQDAIGHRFRRDPEMPWIEIVGIVADLRRDGKEHDATPQIYLPAAMTGLYPVRLADLAVRTRVPPAAIARSIEEQVLGLDPEQPVSRVRTLRQTLDADLAPRRFATALIGAFAGLALALALVGIYGVVAYAVSRRTPELGLRMALGAQPRDVLGLVLSNAAARIGLGLVAGLLVALAATRLVAAQLYATPATDPLTFVAAPAVLAACGLLAALLPARRASRIDPTLALRGD